MQTFLTVENYKAASLGGLTSPPGGDAEIAHTIEIATALINAEANEWLLYHTVYDEQHRWRLTKDGALFFRLRQMPVRIVQNMSLLVGEFGGGRVPFGFSTTPVEALPRPVIQGTVIVDRERSSIKVVGPVLFYAPPGLGIMWNAPVGITYTAGYDDGTVQADGMSLPAEDWVVNATRITVRKLLQEAQRVRSGRGLAGSFTTGPVSESYKSDAEAELPQHVKNLIARRMQHYVIGAR